VLAIVEGWSAQVMCSDVPDWRRFWERTLLCFTEEKADGRLTTRRDYLRCGVFIYGSVPLEISRATTGQLVSAIMATWVLIPYRVEC